MLKRVPEPSSFALFAVGGLGLVAYGIRRKFVRQLLSVLAVLAVVGVGQLRAEWKTYTANLDAFTSGQDISEALPGVTLETWYINSDINYYRRGDAYAYQDSALRMVLAASPTGDMFFRDGYLGNTPNKQTLKFIFDKPTDYFSITAVDTNPDFYAIGGYALLTNGITKYFNYYTLGTGATRTYSRATKEIAAIEINPYGAPSTYGGYAGSSYFYQVKYNMDVVPEPSSFALCGGALVVGLVGYIVKKRKGANTHY